ncbi:MAG: peroxide stress protein YaaA [Jatrophihabitans sp.]|nr:MAG: peroxide stress protein YaaA [Jatrophihabitans sp.]
MRILLPPSEAKRPGGRGRPLADRPSSGPLAATRAALTDALVRLLGGGCEAAAGALLLPPGAAPAALAANAAVRDAPTMPALRRYAGVVYAALDRDGLTPAERRLAGSAVIVFSGLWGALRGDEPVPDYRVPAKAKLPGVGVVATAWRPVLAGALPGMLGDGLVVDLRSGDYGAMWRATGDLRERVVSVRVLSPLPGGGRGVVSFASKQAKGRLARTMITAAAQGRPPRQAADVAEAWIASGGRDAAHRGPGRLELHT